MMNGAGEPKLSGEIDKSERQRQDREQRLRFTVYGGIGGLLLGGVNGILYSKMPTLFALASSLQWAGTTFGFLAARDLTLSAIDPKWERRPRQKLIASGIGGGLTGLCAGLVLRGPRSMVPGMIVFSAAGVAGQSALDFADRATERASGDSNEHGQRSLWRRVADMKYSPVTVLTDEQYEKLLREKLLRAEADVALVEDEIRAVKTREGEVVTENKETGKEQGGTS